MQLPVAFERPTITTLSGPNSYAAGSGATPSHIRDDERDQFVITRRLTSLRNRGVPPVATRVRPSLEQDRSTTQATAALPTVVLLSQTLSAKPRPERPALGVKNPPPTNPRHKKPLAGHGAQPEQARTRPWGLLALERRLF